MCNCVRILHLDVGQKSHIFHTTPQLRATQYGLSLDYYIWHEKSRLIARSGSIFFGRVETISDRIIAASRFATASRRPVGNVSP